MSYKMPQYSDLKGCRNRIQKLAKELDSIKRPDRVMAIMMQIQSTVKMYNHCFYILKEQGLNMEEYYKAIGKEK